MVIEHNHSIWYRQLSWEDEHVKKPFYKRIRRWKMNSKQKEKKNLFCFFLYAEFVVDLPTCHHIQQTFPFITFFLPIIWEWAYNKQALLLFSCTPQIHIHESFLSNLSTIFNWKFLNSFLMSWENDPVSR